MALVVCLLVAAACTAVWSISTVLPLGSSHSDNEVERLTPDVAEEQGVAQALADLHGHLNWVIWSRGELDATRWTETLETTVDAMADEGRTDTAAELERVGRLLEQDVRLSHVHDLVEAIEFRYANGRGS